MNSAYDRNDTVKILGILLFAIFALNGICQARRARIKEMTYHQVVWDLRINSVSDTTVAQISVAQPELRKFKLPKYPKSAKKREVSGKVWVAVGITREGKVDEAVICESSGHELLDQAAYKAAKTLRFQPETNDGEPVPSGSSYIVEFIDNQKDDTFDGNSKSRFTVELRQDNQAPFITAPAIKLQPKTLKDHDPNPNSEITTTGVSMLVGKDGSVIDVAVTGSCGDHIMDGAAVAAAYEFKFDPSMFCGQPTVSSVKYNIRMDKSLAETFVDKAMPDAGDYVPVEVPASLIKQGAVVYPRQARDNGFEGVVWVKALVDKTGTVRKSMLARTSGYEMLDQAAVEAAMNYKYAPGYQNSKPVAMWVTYKVEFVLQD